MDNRIDDFREERNRRLDETNRRIDNLDGRMDETNKREIRE